MGLGGLDLNLLWALHALLEHRNVSRAAEKINLSQPATSAALARLRRHFDDELLVRVGREFRLTPLAQVLGPLVASAVEQVQNALDVRSTFDPHSSHRNFVIGASDYAITVLLGPLRRVLRTEAPEVAVTFEAMPHDDSDLEMYLLQVDLLVGPVGYGIPGKTDVLWRDDYVAVLDAANPAAEGGSLSLEALNELPHAVGRFGSGVVTAADRLLDELGVKRRVVARVNGLLALPLMVRDTDLVALVPRRLAHRFAALGGLAVAEIPGAERAQLVEAIHCLPSRSADPALQWLRGRILRAASTLPASGGDTRPAD
jgi:DNA-binding transcriptional LysR family regulator